MASLYIPKWQSFSNSGGTAPLAGGKLNFYTTTTTTRKNTYPTEADALAGTNANPNPVILNSAGRPDVEVWINGRYRLIVTDANDVPLPADDDPIEDVVTGSDAQDSAPTYGGNNSGTANALAFAFSPTLTAYTNGQVLRGRILADNSAAVTVNCDGLGAKSLVKRNGVALASGDLQGPDILSFAYDSTTDVMRLLSPDGVAYLSSNQSFTKAQGVARVALTDAVTVAVDASLSNAFTLTLGGNRTLGAPTNPTDGQSLTIKITQDATGSRTLAYAAGWLFPGGVAPTLSTAAAAVDVLSAVYFADTAKWYGVLNKAFA